MGVGGDFGSGEASLISPREDTRGGQVGSGSSSNTNLPTGESLGGKKVDCKPVDHMSRILHNSIFFFQKNPVISIWFFLHCKCFTGTFKHLKSVPLF